MKRFGMCLSWECVQVLDQKVCIIMIHDSCLNSQGWQKTKENIEVKFVGPYISIMLFVPFLTCSNCDALKGKAIFIENLKRGKATVIVLLSLRQYSSKTKKGVRLPSLYCSLSPLSHDSISRIRNGKVY